MKISTPQIPRPASWAGQPENAAGASSSQPAAADAPAGSSLMLKEQEGANLAENLKRKIQGHPGSTPSTPRAPGAGAHGFFTTPEKVGALPADVHTGCKRPPLGPQKKKSRWGHASPAARNLGRNLQLQLQRQAVDEKIFCVRPNGSISDWREAGRFYVARDAFRIDGTNGVRTVAGKEVQFDGRRYVFLEKNIGIPDAPKYAHGGVLEQSAGGVWQVRQRYAPAMSLGLAGIGRLPLARVKHLEKLVENGWLNDFFGTGSFRQVDDIADQWAKSYRDKVGNWSDDVKVFENNEGKLPIKQLALELTCRDGRRNRGEMRLVLDQQGHLLFTRDHYRSFILLTPSSPARLHVNALPMSVAPSGGGLFDPHHLATFLLRQRVGDVRGAFRNQRIFDGKGSHSLEAVWPAELWRLRDETGLNLSPGFSPGHCRRISGTGVVIVLPPGQDDSRPPRVFVEGCVGTGFSEVVSDKADATSLAYFKVPALGRAPLPRNHPG